MLQRFLLIAITLCSLSASAQWQLTGSKVRYVNGLGIPTKDTASGVSADSSQIQIRPQDSSLYIKYKRTWIKVGGTGFTGTGTANYIPKFTSPSVLGNSRIIDDGSLYLFGFTSSQSGIALMQVSGGIFSSSAGYPLSLQSISNSSFNPFYYTGSNLFGAIGNYSGLISGLGPSPNDSMMGMLGTSSMFFATGGTNERVRITTGGQVNIAGNFTSTNNALQVAGNVAIGSTTAAPTNGLLVTGNIITGGNIGINLSGGATNNSYGITSNGDATTNTGGMVIRRAGTDVMYIGNIATNNTTDFEFWNPRNGYTRFGTNNLERMRITSDGNVLINTTTDNGTDKLQVNGSTVSTQYKLSALNTAPASATATGTTGEIRVDANYIYICTATNTWKRVAIATW